MIEQEIFLVESPGWAKPIIVGLAVYAVNSFVGWNLYYIHFYLFLAGGISYLFSRSKYVTVNKNGIYFYYGFPLFQKVMILKWSQISNIEPHYIPRRGISNAGKHGLIPFDHKKETLRISLNEVVSIDIRESLKRYNRFRIFSEGFKISNEGSEIILIDQPENGFLPLLKAFSRFVTVNNLKLKEDLNKLEKTILSFFVLIGSTVIVMLVILLFNYKLR